MSLERFAGIFAATVCPLHADERIDEVALAAHLAAVGGTDQLSGFLINGHAGENFTLAQAEKRRVLEIARAAVPRHLLVAGVNQEATAAAVTEAQEAADAGADALLLFPPFSWALACDPPVILAHHAAVANATDLPLCLYQSPVGAARMAYPPELLAELVRLPSVAGIKEGSWEVATYEANRRLVHSIRPELRVMASGDEHLLSCFLFGSEGSMVSLAALIPETIVALERAVLAEDMAAARAAHDVIYPLAKAIYGTAPAARATARLKWLLARTGRIPLPTMRRPAQQVGPQEAENLSKAAKASDIRF